jgi:hypothetical protein
MESILLAVGRTSASSAESLSRPWGACGRRYGLKPGVESVLEGRSKLPPFHSSLLPFLIHE